MERSGVPVCGQQCQGTGTKFVSAKSKFKWLRKVIVSSFSKRIAVHPTWWRHLQHPNKFPLLKPPTAGALCVYEVLMETAKLAGAPLSQVPGVLPTAARITWESMKVEEWNARSCELWQNHFVAFCEQEWINPLHDWCNKIHKPFLEKNT